MQKQVELQAEMVRQAKRYRDLARALRTRGIEVETDDVLAVVDGKRRAMVDGRRDNSIFSFRFGIAVVWPFHWLTLWAEAKRWREIQR